MTSLAKFVHLQFHDQLLLIRASLLLAIVKLGLHMVPFRLLRLAVVCFARPTPTSLPGASAEHIAWAVTVVSQRFGATCLVQAITVYIMLRRRGRPADLRFGVRYDLGKTFIAHAWVESDGYIVIGGLPDLAQYTLLPGVLPTQAGSGK